MYRGQPVLKQRLSAWLRASLQSATFFGAIMIVLVWTGVVSHLRVEHDNAEGPTGLIKASTIGPGAPSIDLRDREHLQVHINAQDDALFISKLLVGRTIENSSIQMARRIRGANNSIAGSVVAELHPGYLTRFYQSIEVGQNGAVALIGLDGASRVNAGFNESELGRSARGSRLFPIQETPVGHFWGTGEIDGFNRLFFDQKVEGIPPAVAQKDIFANYWRDQPHYFFATAALTLFILLVMAIGVRRVFSLECSRRELHRQNQHFKTILESLPQGLATFDADTRLVVYNETFVRMYGHSPEEVKPGTTLRHLVDCHIAKGVYADANITAHMLELGTHRQGANEVRELRNGRTIATAIKPMPGGGWVSTHEDITEIQRREESFRLLFKNNPIPMWVLDVESFRFLDVNDAAIAHYGYSREQFLAMTALDIRPVEERDRFLRYGRVAKGVNDGNQIWLHQKSNGTTFAAAIFSRPLTYEGHPANLAAVIDVTDRKRAEEDVRRARAFLDMIVENVPMTIVVKNAQDRRYVLINRAGEKLLGFSRDNIIGKSVHDIYPTEVADAITASDAQTLQSGQELFVEEGALTTPHNGRRVITARRHAIFDENGQPLYLLAVLDDVTERKRTERQIVHMAHHDALTGLANRALFLEKVDEALARVRRYGGEFAVLLLDLDRFKAVNDSLGHPAGDALLKMVADRLRAATRETDVLARLGGDEFAILQDLTADHKEGAIVLANRILEAIAAPYRIDRHDVNIGTSIGISLAPDDAQDANTLLKNSDLALYKSKAKGRNNYCFFEAEMEAIARARHALENDLHRAMAHDEFEIHYHPVIDIGSRSAVGMEALIRWHHPGRGMVSPADFIPLAEETGLIVPLGEWILRKACMDAVNWPAHIKVAVNLSSVQFRKSNLVDLIGRILVQSGLPAERLELEITESVLLHDHAANLAILHQLRDLGAAIVLDDFGTGYSSLNYLRKYPFDKIKIDKSFVDEIATSADCAAIVCAITGLARSLDVITTAEGVEHEDQYELLRAAGCDQAQGWLFSHSVPVADLEFDAPNRQRSERFLDEKPQASPGNPDANPNTPSSVPRANAMSRSRPLLAWRR